MSVRVGKEVQEMLRSVKAGEGPKAAASGQCPVASNAAKAGAGGQGPGASSAAEPRMAARIVRLATGHWPLATLLLATLLLATAAHAAIFPDTLGNFTRGAPSTLTAPDRALYEEYGLQATERTEYTSEAGAKFTAEAWRLRDSTGAFALFQARRPAGATPSDAAELAAKLDDGVLLAHGNYLFHFTGRTPEKAELDALFYQLPQLEQSSLPTLTGFLPTQDLVPNSHRYILGPVSLDRFEARIPPSVAAFSLGAEAQLARYRAGNSELTLLIFNYPTPGMARERQDEFLKLPGTLAKRTGPLVAVTVQPPDADFAERVLGRVEYAANITWSEQVEPRNEAAGWGRLILTGFLFAGVLAAASLLAGLGLGALRALVRKLGWSSGPDTLTVLRIRDK